MGGFTDDFNDMEVELKTEDVAMIINGIAKLDTGDQKLLEVCID